MENADLPILNDNVQSEPDLVIRHCSKVGRAFA